MQHPLKKTGRRRPKRLVVCVSAAVCLLMALTFVLLLPMIRTLFPAQQRQMEIVTQTQRVFEVTEAERLERVT